MRVRDLRPVSRWLLAGLAALAIAAPALAADGAAITLSGKPLFTIGDSAELKADERGALVQHRIDRWLASSDHAAPRVVQGRRGATILLGDDPLLVVNPADMQLNRSTDPIELANTWAQALAPQQAPAAAPASAPSLPALPAPNDLVRHLGGLLLLLVGGAIAGWLVLWGTARLADNPEQHGVKLPGGLVTVLGTGLALLLGAATAAVALSHVGSLASPWMAGVAIALGAVALVASAELLGNLAGGLTIRLNGLYQVGDRVRLGGHAGEVARLGLVFTRLVTARHGQRHIPNATVLRRGVSVASETELRTLELPVRLAYTVPRELAEAILLEAAHRTEGIGDAPSPEVLLAELEDDVIRYQLTATLDESEHAGAVTSRFHVNLLDVLAENELGPGGNPAPRSSLRMAVMPLDQDYPRR